MSTNRFTNRGFAKIRRGFREHLSRMSSDGVKLYLWLHLVVFWSGKKRGTVETNYSEIAKELQWTKIRVKRAMAELRCHYVKVSKRGNQHQDALIRILKYTKHAKSAGITHEPSKTAGVTNEPSYDPSTDPSTLRERNKTLQNRAPKKAVEGSRSKAAAATAPKRQDSVWSFLEIEPCGPLAFRCLLESRWASRNGDRLSVLIGETVDAWEKAEGEKLRRSAPLFRALAKLRKSEAVRPTDDGRSIHVLTAEEIPA